MDQDRDPYAPPEAPLGDARIDEHAWHDGRCLVFHRLARLHGRCVRCGSGQATAPLHLRRVWRNPRGCGVTLLAAMLLILMPTLLTPLASQTARQLFWLMWVSLPVLVIVANLVWRSPTLRLQLALCPACRRLRRRWLLQTGVLFSAAVAAALALAVLRPQWLAFAFLAAPLLLLAARLLDPLRLRVTRVRGDLIWLRGPRPAALQAHPPIEQRQPEAQA